MMVTKHLTIEVSDVFNNNTFLKASPQDKTEIITIGTNIHTEIKNRLIDNYKNNSDRKIEIDQLIQYETDKLLEKHNKEISEYKSKCSNLEGVKDALECQVKYMAPQLTELNKTLFNNDNKVYDEVQKQKQKIRNNYENIISELKDNDVKLRSEMKQLHNEYQEREDSIRKSCEEKIEEIRTKYDNMNNIYHNSSKKGKSGEIHAHNVLVSIFPTATITDTNKQTASGDCHINYNGVNILYENKNYDKNNIPKRDIIKFIRDVTINTKCEAGIMVSQKTGIANRGNFSISYTENGKPLIFLHKVLGNENNIKYGVELLVAVIKNGLVFDESKIAKIKNMLDHIKSLKKCNECHKKNIEPIMSSYNSTKSIISELETIVNSLINDKTDEIVIKEEIKIDDTIPIENMVPSPNINLETTPVSNIKLDLLTEDNIQTNKKYKKKKHISKNKTKEDNETPTKKPQSGFFLWMNTNRESIKKDLLDKKIEGNISILVAKEAGKIWNMKTDEEKNIWKEKAKSQTVNS